ncbi:MAG: hypothetical protein AAFY28_07910 [Actinomycetota bacterium]
MSGLAAPQRGSGIGLELTATVVRGVRFVDGELTGAAEVAIGAPSDDRALVDALVFTRAELDDDGAPTRLATFAQGATLQRRDVTGLTGVELNTVRHGFAEHDDIGSTLLLDDGPRRWLMVIGWADRRVRHLEQLAELAGFVDVTVEPSPVALARTSPPDITRTTRVAAPGDTFAMVQLSGVPVAAASVSGTGITAPDLGQRRDDVSSTWFDELVEPPLLAAELTDLGVAEAGGPVALRVGDGAYPDYPDADLRSARRQCVALGAAIGAAGLRGPLRPVDTVEDAQHADAAGQLRRPWAVERVPESTDPTTGEVLRPRRRRGLRRLWR